MTYYFQNMIFWIEIVWCLGGRANTLEEQP